MTPLFVIPSVYVAYTNICNYIKVLFTGNAWINCGSHTLWKEYVNWFYSGAKVCCIV